MVIEEEAQLLQWGRDHLIAEMRSRMDGF